MLLNQDLPDRQIVLFTAIMRLAEERPRWVLDCEMVASFFFQDSRFEGLGEEHATHALGDVLDRVHVACEPSS
jgi:hypothetical protein